MNLTKVIDEQKIILIRQKVGTHKGQRRKIPHEAKLNKAKRICELYSQGIYTLKSCCAVENVKYSTFQYWAQPNRVLNSKRRGFMHDVHALYKKAVEENKENFTLLLKQAVREGILLKARGSEFEEVKTTIKLNGLKQNLHISKKKIIILPSDLILIYLANSLKLHT